jgi:hypothetical protein
LLLSPTSQPLTRRRSEDSQFAYAPVNVSILPPRAASGLAAARFARDPREYRPTARPDWLQVIDGGDNGEQGLEGLW